MTIIPYEADKDFSYFLIEKLGVSEQEEQKLITQLRMLFPVEDFSGYQVALFISFLLYVVGDNDRLSCVSSRMAECANDSYFPKDLDSFLEVWFAGSAPEVDTTIEPIFQERIMPLMQKLSALATKEAQEFSALLITSFKKFYKKIETELFLQEQQIHSDELTDPELEDEAVRWEYKYLGREPEKIAARRAIYLKRQEECLKSN